MMSISFGVYRSVESLLGGCRKLCLQTRTGKKSSFHNSIKRHCYEEGSHSNRPRMNRQEQQRRQQQHYEQDHQSKGNILKPLVFTACVGGVSLVGCSIAHYERTRQKIQMRGLFDRKRNVFKLGDWRLKINSWWQGLNEGRKVAAGIIALNVGVFLCWRIPGAQRFMAKWFAADPTARSPLPLLLSCFSHTELWHIGANMFVLWSFSPLINSILGPEQFVGFYLTGGAVASLTSHFYKLATATMTMSLGASGALLAVLGACCIEKPEARIAIIFLPFFTFSAKTALIGIIGFDLCGLIFRLNFFDHAAHLGGTLFGVLYIRQLKELTWDKRSEIVRSWHQFRESR